MARQLARRGLEDPTSRRQVRAGRRDLHELETEGLFGLCFVSRPGSHQRTLGENPMVQLVCGGSSQVTSGVQPLSPPSSPLRTLSAPVKLLTEIIEIFLLIGRVGQKKTRHQR